MNKIMLGGRIATKLELTQGEKTYCSFLLAVKKTGDEAYFFPIVAFNDNAIALCSYCSKGSYVNVMGHLKINDMSEKIEIVAEMIEFVCKPKEE